MKFAIVLTTCAACLALLASGEVLRASEPAVDCQNAVDSLVAGFEVHHDQALVLFEDALQTNPACRRQLFLTAVELMGEERGMLASLIHVARATFPEEDSLFAEAAMSFAPDRSEEIRAAFLSAPEEMGAAALAEAALGDPALPSPADLARTDDEIREAIARMAAKATGKPWPEQSLSDEPLRFKKHDEVRIPRASRGADESSLVNSLPIDQHDERVLGPQPVSIDDGWTRDDLLRLDESKFSRASTDGAEGASTAPLAAKVKEMAPAGAVALPKRPPLPRSSVYYIPPAAGSYESTIDLESDEMPRPPLIIRPAPISPTLPARVR